METLKKINIQEDLSKHEVKGFKKNEENEVSVIAVIGKENDRTLKNRRNLAGISFSSNVLASSSLVDPLSHRLGKGRKQIISVNGKIEENEKNFGTRVIELSDESSKMALRKHLDSMHDARKPSGDCKGMEILQKLPPGTIVIKQEKYKEDSDYVRESTETSSGSSSTSGCGAGRVKRIHRGIGKGRGTTEIRRNPIRVTKKDTDKDFPRPRQRLFSTKRKEGLFDLEPNKRTKSSTMPYMNTRSVTRKLYNVGATYQAPTRRDETEWKEWPVHGMHERPVFHPQIGLAVEYLGRCFTSLDGLSYREVINRPEIEVVSVDPHCEFLPSVEKKRATRKKSTAESFSTKSTKVSTTLEKKNSFESCMHESLHCVLGYCSQIMTPNYNTSVAEKLNKLSRDENVTPVRQEKDLKSPVDSQQITTNVDRCKSDVTFQARKTLQRPTEKSKASVSQTITNFSQVAKTRLFPTAKMYIANQQKPITLKNLKTLPSGQIKLQDIRGKSPLILVNPAEAKTLKARILKPTSTNGNPMKFDATVGDAALMEMSSMYKSLLACNNIENSQMINTTSTSTSGGKIELTKYSIDNLSNKVQSPKGSNEIQNGEDIKTMASWSKTWCTNETSEIAKILSDYNKSTLKKPAIEKPSYTMTNFKVKESKNENQRPPEDPIGKKTHIQLPQGKWRRFHLTVEKLKDVKSNEKRIPTRTDNKRSSEEEKIVLGVSANFTIKDNEVSRCAEPFELKVTGEEKSRMKYIEESKTQSLQELLESTATLYCAATGTHQDDLASYIDSLDAKQSTEWLESCESLID